MCASPDTLAQVEQPNLPPTCLTIFPGCICTLLRNLDVQSGLANGTKLIVLHSAAFCLRVKIVSGQNEGAIHTLPRIRFDVTSPLQFKFTRKQFPVKVAYCITANRSQGMTIDSNLLIDVTDEAFIHGQMYVAFSRSTKSSLIRVVGAINAEGRHFVKNIVYQQILTPTTPIMHGAMSDDSSDCGDDDSA